MTPVCSGCPVCLHPEVAPFWSGDGRDYGCCSCCQAVFLDPAQYPERDAESARYRLHRNDPGDPAYRAFLARLSEPLLHRLRPGSTGLDYGCGPGPALAAMLGEAGFPTRCYDPFFFRDEEALRETYDFITCTETVEHFHRPHEEFARLRRLLRPGGWLGIMTCFLPEEENFARWHYRRDPTHVVFYSAATFRVLADRFGWACTFPRRDVVLLRQSASPRNAGSSR